MTPVLCPLASYYTLSWVTASNLHQYLVVSQFGSAPFGIIFSATVLDLDNTTYYTQYALSEVLEPSTVFNYSGSTWGYGSTSASDKISQMRAWSNGNNTIFDITWNNSAAILLNGGLGTFAATGGIGYEWSMPAGETSGTLTVNGEVLQILPNHSVSWYDREWGNIPNGWTWFALHLDVGLGSMIYMSLWASQDKIYGPKHWGTVATAPGINEVVAITSFTPSDRNWTSPSTGATYALGWTLTLADGSELSISSVRDDQEAVYPNNYGAAYEGFVDVSGTYKGIPILPSFGVVEITA